jgi:hypothetical protein
LHRSQWLNRNAETVFRALGNRAGRGRAARDGTPREAAPPECLVVSTGEVRPSGKSLNARVFNIEINPGEILGDSDHKQSDQLALAQADAREGVYARTTTAFIQWVAPQPDARRRQLHELANTNRQSFWKSCRHARLANTAGELLAAFEIFLEFAEEKGYSFEYGIDRVIEGAHEAMVEVLKDQELAQLKEDPVRRNGRSAKFRGGSDRGRKRKLADSLQLPPIKGIWPPQNLHRILRPTHFGGGKLRRVGCPHCAKQSLGEEDRDVRTQS